jgi:hypothetical protein
MDDLRRPQNWESLKRNSERNSGSGTPRSAPPTPVSAIADFDEQWWPVTLLLLTSAGCLAGYVWTTGDFNDPRPLYNARHQLIALGTVVGALLLGVLALRGSSQRRLQLGVFLSLAFHAGLLFMTQKVYLKVASLPPVAEDFGQAEDAVVTIPDYLPTEDGGKSSDELTRPAETELRQEPKTEVTPQLPTPVEAAKESVPEPEVQRQAQPTPLELAKVELTAPRRNEVLSGASLSRKELPDKLPTEAVPDRQLNAASQPALAMNATKLEAERREAAETITRRPSAEDRQLPDRPRPDLAPVAPLRRPQEEQVASIDVKAALERRALDRVPQVNDAPAPAAAAPRAIADSPNAPAPTSAAQANARQAAETAPLGSPAPIASPNVTFTPNAPSPAEVQRAETAEPSPQSVASLTPRQPSRIAAAAAGAGVEQVPIEATSAAAASATPSAGGSTLEATATALRRGNQGTPQTALETGSGLASPLGSGIGTTVGGTIVGVRREETQGDAGSASASAATIVGRPGRARAAGPVDAPLAAVPISSLAGAPGTTNTPGNAVAGTNAALQPSSSAAGAIRGSGAAGPLGPSTARPDVGGLAAANGTSGSSLTGLASGVGSASSNSAGLGGVPGPAMRRDDGLAPSSATGVGRSSTAKLNPGDGLVALPGAGTIAVPSVAPATDSTSRGGEANAPSAVAGAVGMRREAAGLPVMVRAPEGPGGLTTRPSTDVGIPSRRARAESEVAHLEMNRLIPERIGGKKSGGGQLRDTAVVGLKQRDPTGRGEIAKAMGGSEATEHAVELGLEFLARHQAADGSWRLHDFGAGKPEYRDAGLAQMEANTAGTGLALLAFLGAGYTHADGKFAAVVERGLSFLLRNQKPDGDLFIPPANAAEANTWLYSHGIASIALCEALGMSRDDELLKQPAQRAIDFIVAAQNPELGGWRYLPRIGSDTSVSGWQLMALKSAERVGLVVPPKTYALVTKWLDFAQGVDGDPTRYAYMPQSEFAHQKVVSRVMTAEALLMRQYLGWNRNHPYLTGGADFLLTQLPAIGTEAAPDRDSYYWYYATQVMFHMKGNHWRQWNEKLRPLLVDSQLPQGPLAGSWDPGGAVPDRWGGAGGRVYVTAMHLLMLEVYYRYLPLYQNLEE